MIIPKWKEELRDYLLNKISDSIVEISKKFGRNAAFFIEHEESNNISIYYSRKYIINSNGNYIATGEKILYTRIDITQFNRQTNERLRLVQISCTVNEVIETFYCKFKKSISNN